MLNAEERFSISTKSIKFQTSIRGIKGKGNIFTRSIQVIKKLLPQQQF